MDKNNPKIKNQSVYKAFTILECFSAQKPEHSITEISAMVGLYKSNVYNIIATLEEMGYMIQNKETRKYYLGNRFFAFSSLASNHNSLWKLLPEYLQEIAKETGEVAFFAIQQEGRVYYVSSAYPDGIQPLNAMNMTGMSKPMHCTALGKVLLAFASGDALESFLETAKMDKLTNNTITDKDAFREEIKKIRAQTYAFDNMEQVYGISCLAVPVFVNGALMGAISISGSSLRFSYNDVIRLYQILVKHVSKLENIA